MPINEGALLDVVNNGSSGDGYSNDLSQVVLSSSSGGSSARGAMQGIGGIRSQVDQALVPNDFVGKMGPILGVWFVDDSFVQPF